MNFTRVCAKKHDVLDAFFDPTVEVIANVRRLAAE